MKNSKRNNRKNRFVALLLVFSMLVPSFSYVTAQKVYALGTDDAISGDGIELVLTDVANYITVPDLNVLNEADTQTGAGADAFEYVFKLNYDKEVYNYDTGVYTFDGEEFEGVYTGTALKADDNVNLTMDELGTIENPYVILEITPDARYSELRRHIGDAGYFDLTQQQLDEIQLTEEEETVVRIQTLYRIINEFRADKTAYYEVANNVQNLKIQRLDEIYTKYVKQEAKKYALTYETRPEGIPDDQWMYLDPYKTQYEAALNEYFDKYYPGCNMGTWQIKYDVYSQSGDKNVKKQADDEMNRLIAEQYPGFVANEEWDNIVDLEYALEHRGEKTVLEVLKEAEEDAILIMGAYEFTRYMQGKMDAALQYKKDYYKSSYYAPLATAGYKSDYNFIKQYKVENGEFVRLTDDTTDGKTITNLDGSYGTNGYRGEYLLENTFLNPLAITENAFSMNIGASGDETKGKLYTSTYPFRKSALNLAYKSQIVDGVIVGEQTAYVDEYIFVDWCVEVEGEIKAFSNLTSEEVAFVNEQLATNQIKNLYTSWAVRRYGTTYYEKIQPYFEGDGKVAAVEVEFGDNQYNVWLPDEIASNHPMQEGAVHHYKNQLSMCIPVTTELLTTNQAGFDLLNTPPNADYFYTPKQKSFVEELSSWDFVFSMSKYNSIEKLQQVAPKLMSDTDYYVKTYNCVIKEGVVEYYPFNVVIQSITPEELNKLVYFDSSYKNKTSAVGYVDVPYVKSFFNNVDFFYIANGGGTIYFEKTMKNIRINDLVRAGGTDIPLVPVRQRCPTLFEKIDGEYVYDADKVISAPAKKMTNTDIDIEWQIAYNMYTRIMNYNQKRRAAMIANEAFTDNVVGDATSMPVDGSYGTKSNWAKFFLLIFAYEDPTLMYDFYANPDYKVYGFDKMIGVARDETYLGSRFTGMLYDETVWNTMIFLPFELSNLDHKTEMLESKYRPQNAANSDIGLSMFTSIGLAWEPSFKYLANPFAYAFNGDNALGLDFFKPIIENKPGSVQQGINRTYLAFEYFQKVRPSEIVNGKIAPESAIEFMVQNVRNGAISNYNRKIEILNKSDEPARFLVNGERLNVDSVIIEDFSSGNQHIDYKFTSDVGGYFVVEFLWTPVFKDIDSDPRLGRYFFEENTIRHAIWLNMPTYSGHADAKNNFINYVINKVDNYDGDKYINTDNKYDKEKPLEFHRDVEYYFDALWRPIADKDAMENSSYNQYFNQPRYIIAVKQYTSKEAYEQNPDNFKTVTLKNVILEKMTYLFNLD